MSNREASSKLFYDFFLGILKSFTLVTSLVELYSEHKHKEETTMFCKLLASLFPRKVQHNKPIDLSVHSLTVQLKAQQCYIWKKDSQVSQAKPFLPEF